MLTDEQTRKKIFEQPALFEHHYHNKEWPQAKYIYDTTQRIAVFIELGVKDMMELFGEKAYTDDDNPKDGLFKDEYVSNVYLECIRRNQTYEREKRPGIDGQKKWE